MTFTSTPLSNDIKEDPLKELYKTSVEHRHEFTEMQNVLDFESRLEAFRVIQPNAAKSAFFSLILQLTISPQEVMRILWRCLCRAETLRCHVLWSVQLTDIGTRLSMECFSVEAGCEEVLAL